MFSFWSDLCLSMSFAMFAMNLGIDSSFSGLAPEVVLYTEMVLTSISAQNPSALLELSSQLF